MKTIWQIISLGLVFPIHLLSCVIPKNKKLWIFGSLKGQKYLDNSKYLFEYVSNVDGVEAVWISRTPAVLEEVKNKGLKACAFISFKGIATAMRASVAVVTHRGIHRQADLPFFALSPKTKVVQLWHGVPLKKIAFDDVIFSCKKYENAFFNFKIKIAKIFFPYIKYIDNPAMVICPSKFSRPIFSKAFRVPEKKVVITGYPRNDMFFRQNTGNKPKNGISIIYMPTFRGDFGEEFDPLFQFGFDIEKFDNFLENNRMKLALKLHPFNLPDKNSLHLISRARNIYLYKGDDIYEEINAYDVLITDYSSIFFDFLLAKKPMIFTPFDRDDYLVNSREFYFDYDEFTPGPKAYSWDDVCKWLGNLPKLESMYKSQIDDLREQVHKFKDGKSCERVFKSINNLIL